MTPINIFAQIINFIGSTIDMIGVNLKNKRIILIFFIIGNSCIATALGILNAKAGMIVQVVFVIETIINYYWEQKYDKYPTWLIALYLIIPTTIIIITSKTYWNILPIIAGISFPLAMLSKDFKLRFLNLISVIAWIPYNFHFKAYTGTICCIIFTISNIYAIIRLDVLKKNQVLESEISKN